MTTGYSGTPLAMKLGLKAGMRAWFQNVPDHVRAEIDRDAPPLERLDLPEPPVEFAHIFVTSCAVLDCEGANGYYRGRNPGGRTAASPGRREGMRS